VWIDERFTSFAADQTLREMWRSDNIGAKDALAAAEILQTYLDTKK
jgi:RNase H-fold protein (predicted Holliday junction resolvase)